LKREDRRSDSSVSSEDYQTRQHHHVSQETFRGRMAGALHYVIEHYYIKII